MEMPISPIEKMDAWDEIQAEVQGELEQAQKSLKEVNVMVEQSQSEINRLTQRNAGITGRLQQIQHQMDSLSRKDILEAYNDVLDIQQRLLVMRGQLERLQSERDGLERLVAVLKRVALFLAEQKNKAKSGAEAGNGTTTLEMVINSQEAVRQRLSRQMHDGPAQALSNFIVQTEIASRLFEINPDKAKEELENLRSTALQTFQKVRSFIYELRPMMLDDLGLFPTLRRYVEAFKEQTGVEVELKIHGQERRLESYLEVMIFRALQELMGNVVRHNQDYPSKLQIIVQLDLEDNHIQVTVSDNGKGFDTQEVFTREGLGLKIIRDRVGMLGGHMKIDSTPGKGSKVFFQIPYLGLERTA